MDTELGNKKMILDTINRIRNIKDNRSINGNIFNRREVYIVNVITMADLLTLSHDEFCDGERTISVGINKLTRSQVKDFILYIFDNAARKFELQNNKDIIHIRSLLI